MHIAKLYDGRTISNIVEKDVISDNPSKDPLVVGSFWFRRTEDFINISKYVVKNNINVNGEHYVANSINLLINEGKKFVIFDIEKWVSFGDPLNLKYLSIGKNFFCRFLKTSFQIEEK